MSSLARAARRPAVWAARRMPNRGRRASAPPVFTPPDWPIPIDPDTCWHIRYYRDGDRWRWDILDEHGRTIRSGRDDYATDRGAYTAGLKWYRANWRTCNPPAPCG